MTRLTSIDPARGTVVWEGDITTDVDVSVAIDTARSAFDTWSITSLAERIAHVEAYAATLCAEAEPLARLIARENGKPLWEARQEVASMIGKVAASIAAQAERAGERETRTAFGAAVLRHRPHGVIAVLGPYNFPGHLPNGHIIPALLAGNTIVFKPSEHTPATGAAMARLWEQAGLPRGTLTVVQGGRETGATLVAGAIDGLLFTGSAQAGAVLRRALVDRPEVIMALELGGNNPIIAWDGDPAAIASIVGQSAFATTGQRCSCARRLIVPEGAAGDAIVDAVLAFADRLRIGAWDDDPAPALGPLISHDAVRGAQVAVAELMSLGARELRPLAIPGAPRATFVRPAVIDVTGCAAPDAEIFAPVLQVIRVKDFYAAIAAANRTRYGLSSSLVSRDEALWRFYADRARAGVVNWNRPTTGAAATMPFGGVGASGNHRPSAYYAADYCAYPVASIESARIADLSDEVIGLDPAVTRLSESGRVSDVPANVIHSV